MKRPLAVLALLFLAPAIAPAADDRHAAEIDAWRRDRVARLTAPDGWLTLIGLHFLREGVSTVGSAQDNDVVLAKGPARLGNIALAADGGVSLTLADGVNATVEGRPCDRVVLEWRDPAKPTTVVVGTLSLFVIDRGGRKALRVKDSAAERRTQFAGLDYFPIDPSWRIAARWVPFEKSRMVPITNLLGQTSPALVPGKAVFEREGRRFELLPLDEGPEHPLFFVISDATSGHETYPAARFVYAERPRDGIVVLDFNRAQNPPCAFTPFATCPLPPKENRLPIAVRAGEKNYRGGHE